MKNRSFQKVITKGKEKTKLMFHNKRKMILLLVLTCFIFIFIVFTLMDNQNQISSGKSYDNSKRIENGGGIQIYNDLIFHNYGQDSFKIEEPCRLLLDNISLHVNYQELEGIYLYYCEKNELEEIDTISGTINHEISNSGNYILYAITKSRDTIVLSKYVSFENADEKTEITKSTEMMEL